MPLHDLKVYLYECISESEGDYLSLYSSDPETLVDENIVIQDVLTGQIIEEDADFSETGMYIFYPAGVHPMALNVFMKDGEDYRNLDNDSTEEVVSAMTGFDWTECVDYHAEESELKDYGLDEPDASVTVSYTDEDGESGEFAYELGKSGEEYYAKLKDSSIIYSVEQEVYDAAVNASYEELKPDEAILLDWDTVESIEIEMDGSTYSIGVQSNGEDEYTYTFDDSEVEFGDALDELENVSIDPEEEAELNDNKAELSLTFRRNTEEYSTVELDFYQHNGTYCIAVLDGEVTGCVAREDVVSLKEAVNTVVLGGEEE